MIDEPDAKKREKTIEEADKLSPLDHIYQADEKKEYFSTLEKGKRLPLWKKWWIGVFVVLFILSGTTLAGFFAFQPKKKFSGQNIKLEFEGPQTVSSGQSFSFTIDYQNNESVALKKSELTVSFPDGFTFEDATPSPDNEFKNSWNLRDITKNGRGKILIKGNIIGENDSPKIITAKLNFEPENFSSSFDATKDYRVRLNDSSLKLEMAFPSKIPPGQELSGKMTLHNTSDKPLKDIRLEAVFPTDLTIKQINPEPMDARWDISELTPDKPFEITVSGALSGVNGEFKEIKVKASMRNERNEFILQTDTNSLISIISPNIVTSLMVNGKPDGVAVDWGDALELSLKIKNAGDETVRDAIGKITVDSTVVDWKNIKWTVPGKIQKNTLIWEKDKFPDLLELSPGAETTLSATLLIIQKPPKNVSTNDLIITINGEMSSKNIVDLEGIEIKSDAAPIEVRVTTQVQLKPEARYTDDEYQILGSGPVPPAVGKTTSYQIQWYLSNASNEVTNVRVSTYLPRNVFWNGREEVTSGVITFDPATREIAWSINRVPARSGLDLPGLLATFTISVTPKDSDIGNAVTLTEQTSLEALDNFTNQIIQKKFDVLTTDIPTDPKYAGQGKVVAPTAVNTNISTDANINSSTQ